MCAPALGMVGAAVSAIGSIASANAAASNAEYNARVEKINARSRRQEGLSESERIAGKYDRVAGEQQTGYGKAGVDPFFGSALSVFGETTESRNRDQSANYTKAESAATAHENKARQYEYEAKSQRKAGMIGAATSLIGGLGGGQKAGGGAAGGFGSILRIG
jgi:hypothetical protein